MINQITSCVLFPLKRGSGFLLWICITLVPVLSSHARADNCLIHDEASLQVIRQRLNNVDMLVTVCPYCEDNSPVPLRVREYTLRHTAPDSVSLVFYNQTFPISALEQAEQSGTGPLVDALRAEIEKEYKDTTGYLPGDPFLEEEKLARYNMMLRFAREDLALRTWDELFINGEAVNPALLYYPVGNHQYKSLGAEAGCDLYIDAPLQVTYTPVDRDPEHETPPEIYITDITNQCYDGSCPRDTWTVISETPFYDQSEGQTKGVLPVDEKLKPVQTLSYVKGGKAIAYKDKGRIFAEDIFYLLDSLGEGFYRFWHYGDVFIADTSSIRRPGGWNYCDEKNTCWAELVSVSESTWWSKVQRDNGETVWIKEPLNTIRGVLED